MAAPDTVASLASSSLPPGVAEALLNDVSELWLLSAEAEVLAGDLAHCHPQLGPDEVRASVRPASGAFRLTVVARDRPGLLAATAGALASRGLSVLAASVTTWPARDLALQGITFVGGPGQTGHDEVIADVMGALADDRRPSIGFKPSGPVTVVASPAPLGHSLVTVEAPDRIGLLWAVTSWFAGHGDNVVAAQLSEVGGRAKDLFLVHGAPDADELAAFLAGLGPRKGLLRRRVRI